MPSCVVPGCTSGYTSNKEKFHFFTIPKDPAIADKWRRAIKRKDVYLKTGRAVCENHFRKDEILWQHQLLGPDGCVLGVTQYKIPRLKDGSVPSLFPWTEVDGLSHVEAWNVLADVPQNQNLQFDQRSELQPGKLTSAPSNRPATDDLRSESGSLLPHAKREKLSSSDQQNDQINTTGIKTKTCVVNTEALTMRITFAEMLAAEISLPSGWIVEKQSYQCQNLMMIFTMKIVKVNEMFVPFILKSLVVKDDMSVDLSVLGLALDLQKFDMPGHIDNIGQLQDLLLSINCLNVCIGCTGASFETAINQLDCSTIKRDKTGQWRHDMCNLLLRNVKICKFCQIAKKTVGTKLRRWKESQGKKRRTQIPTVSPTQKARWLELQSKHRSTVQAKVQAREKIKMLKSKVLACHKTMPCVTESNFTDLLEEGSLSQK